MSPWVLPLIVIAYFLILVLISFLTSRDADNATFFVGNRKSPWFLVAYGMIGASISGVTFISIPGEVGNSMFSYMQVVFGYFAGYLIIANVLLPLYYRMNLSSIYVYLEKRFGWYSYKTGAFYFLLSRVIGAAFRLYLVAMVIDAFALSHLGIPFWITVCITISLIYLYSFRAGIRTIVYTDTLQTTFLLLGVILSIVMISQELGYSLTDIYSNISESRYSKLFIWEWRPGNNFFKHFLSGVFICITMTGLDQDMMQKNLSCRNIKEAKKNMYWMSSLLIIVNILFLSLGALLYIYSNTKGIMIEHFAQPDLVKKCPIELLNPITGAFSCEKTDALFPFLVFNYLPPIIGIVFVIGLIAAAYSSADSALTALTTSFCVDFLNFKEDNQRMGIRKLVHVGFSVLLIVVILTFSAITNQSVINSLFTIAGYTYGPLLGLFSFGILTKYNTGEKWVPVITVAAILLSYLTSIYSETLFNGYRVGFEIVVLNGLLVFLGLFLSRRRGLKR